MTGDKEIKGYTKEMVKEILGSSWPTMPEGQETGNQMRRRKGREMREGKRPYPTYPAKKVGPQFDENGNIFTHQVLDLIIWKQWILILLGIVQVVKYHERSSMVN